MYFVRIGFATPIPEVSRIVSPPIPTCSLYGLKSFATRLTIGPRVRVSLGVTPAAGPLLLHAGGRSRGSPGGAARGRNARDGAVVGDGGPEPLDRPGADVAARGELGLVAVGGQPPRRSARSSSRSPESATPAIASTSIRSSASPKVIVKALRTRSARRVRSLSRSTALIS